MIRQITIGIGIVVVVILVFIIARAMIGNDPRSYFDDPHKEELAADLKAFLASPLTRITLQKENPWDKWDIEYTVSQENKLQAFTAAALQADAVPLSDSRYPLLGTTIVLSNSTGERRYIATVHRDELEDLFISNVFPVETSAGTYTRGPGKEVRLPGLGRWIMMAAPVSCGAALRDKCATGEVQPADME